MVQGRIAVPAFVAVAVLASSAVEALPLSLNPFTPGGDTIELGRKHPALGNIPPADSLGLKASLPAAVAVAKNEDADSAELPGLLNKTTTIITKKELRHLSWQNEDREATEQSSKDLERLEAHFKTKMVVNYKELSKYTSGAAATPPWPSSYWPIYEDGINYAWNKEDPMPPSEKYARAYGLDPKAFTTKISEVNGILSQATRQNCTTNDDCTALKDGSSCGKRQGEATGHCIPKWFGICHAWSPAAIEEREPRCAVTKNNVTFEPMDIKALITQAYDGSHLETVFTGTRYNGADEPLKMDEDGRFTDATRRDLGPGFFHIAISNIMGMNKRSFVVDVTAGAEVWNQPVRSYEIISATEMTPDFAATTFFPPRTTYVFNKDAAKIVFIQLKFSWIVESNENGPMIPEKVETYTQGAYYEYILEINADGNIVGGEWVRNSRKEHPDFLWFPKSQPAMDSVADVGIKYKEVRELLDASADCKQIPTDGTTLAPSTPTPTLPAVTPAPTTATPAPTTSKPAPTAPGQGDGTGSDADSQSGSVAGDGDDDDDDDDSDDISAGSVVPMPSPKPTTVKPSSTPTPTPTPKISMPPAVVPVPTPAPVPAADADADPGQKPAKGSVAPVVPAPAPTPAPAPAPGKPSAGKPSAGKPTPVAPTPAGKPATSSPAAADADADADADDDDDDEDIVKPGSATAAPAATPAPTKKTRCRAE